MASKIRWRGSRGHHPAVIQVHHPDLRVGEGIRCASGSLHIGLSSQDPDIGIHRTGIELTGNTIGIFQCRIIYIPNMKIVIQVFHGNDLDPGFLKVIHALLKKHRIGGYPWMRNIRHSMELEYQSLSLLCPVYYGFEVSQGPFRIGIRGGRDNQAIIHVGIKKGSGGNPPVGHFRLHSPPGKPVTQSPDLLHRARGIMVSGIRETDGFGNAVCKKRRIHAGQFRFHGSNVCFRDHCEVGPAMISDLKSHLIQGCHILPLHEIGSIFHPCIGDKKGGSESFFLQQGSYKFKLGPCGIIKG